MSKSTQEVMDHHNQAFGSGDREDILEDYADDVAVIMPDGSVIQGKEQLGGLIDMFLSEFAQPGTEFSMNQVVVAGDLGYTSWSAETSANSYELGSETYQIRDGKIVAQTIAMKVTPK